jgi:hypothetical protein
MLILIDNYDSFTYNLFQYFSELGEKVMVFRNDKTTIAEIEALKPDKNRDFTRPFHAPKCRYLQRRHQTFQPQNPDARGLSGT